MKTRLSLLLCMLSMQVVVFAQMKIGDNPTNINPNSILELETAAKGFVPPRVFLTDVLSATPLNTTALNGTVIFNTNASIPGGAGTGLYYWDSTNVKWIPITPTSSLPTGPAGGDLSGTYPNPTVAKINGVTLGTTTATSGNLLIGSGTQWVTNPMSGDATIAPDGALTLATVNINTGTFNNLTVNGKGLVTAASNVAYTTLTNFSAIAPITYNSSTGVISTSMNTNKLIGRTSAGMGVMEEIILGSGLSFSGTILNTVNNGTVTSVTGNAPVIITGTAADPVVNIQGAAADKGGILYSAGAGTSAAFLATATSANQILVSGAAGAAPSWSTGTGLFIFNQTTQQASSNFNISGNGTIGTNLSVTGTSTLTGAVTSNGGITNTGILTSSGNAINLNAGSNFATNINTGTNTGAVAIGGTGNTVTLGANNAGSNVNLPKLSATSVVITDASKNLASSIPTNNTYLFYNGTNFTWQSSSATAWSLTGNSGTTASTSAIGSTVNNNFIGTTDAKDWVIATNNLERMRVASSGNIGINTITPGALLDIVGTGVTTGNGLSVTANAITSGNAINVFSSSAAGTASGSSVLINLSRSGSNAGASHTAYGINASVTNTGSTSTNIGAQFSASGATNNYALIVPSGGGNAGFNTSSPNSYLDVAGSFASAITSISAATTLNAAHNTIIATPSTVAAYAVTLPASGTANRRLYQIIYNGTDGGSNKAINVTPNGADAIYNNGASLGAGTAFSLTAGTVNLQTDGTGKWYIINDLSNASSVSTAWSLTGNSGTTASASAIGSTVNNNFIGTTDAKDWIIATNNLERMRVASSGNIGINTITPSALLDIVGTGVTTGNGLNVTANAITSGNAINVSSSSTAGTASGSSALINLSRSGSNAGASHTAYGLYASVTNSGSTSTNIAAQFSASGATNNYSIIVPSGGGNVGIGTSTPNRSLVVMANNLNNVITIQNSNNAGYSSVDMYNDAGALSSTFGYANTGTNATFTGRAYFNSYTNDMILTTSNGGNNTFIVSGAAATGGYIGINVASPQNRLHVVATSDPLRLDGLQTGAGTDSILTELNGVVRKIRFADMGWSITGNSGTTAATNFIGTADAVDMVYKTNNTERMRILSGGNVGIGTTAPVTNAVLAIKNGHLQSQQTTAPTKTNGLTTIIGSTGTTTLANATDIAGNITITASGTAATVTGVMMTITYNKTYTTAPIVILTPTNANAAAAMATNKIFITSGTGNFTISDNTTVLPNATYTFNYFVIETQ